ncbi:MAG: TetR/AcrR family transcriptional regulator [Monoglobaceae bacterium]
MAIDIKKLMTDALLELCNTKPLEKISVCDISQNSGVSRTTFYKHFKDMDDLIVYAYKDKIIGEFRDPTDPDFDFVTALIDCYSSDAKYHKFIKQAIQMDSQNCLRDFMIEYSKKFDETWFEHMTGRPMNAYQRMISHYHSAANIQIRHEWILEESDLTPLEKTEFIIRVRAINADREMTGTGAERFPYQMVLDRLSELKK